MATDHVPVYLSSRSADVILSEIRPTRLKTDALSYINALLDELLWLIISSARSLATQRLKSGLLRILPTPLGKEALLEAELELRAYWERTQPTSPQPTDEQTIHDFPLQPAFELLRLKCEAYATLNDVDEDNEAEARLQVRMAHAGGAASPRTSSIAPAALYLTAILESVCQHILANVGRVVARDSSRTIAHVHDLYVALCEDESIYGLFKVMKVQEQIVAQANAMRPRRSKSLSRASEESRPSSRTGSPVPSNVPADGRTSKQSGHSSSPSSSKNSSEKARAIKMIKNGNGNGNGESSEETTDQPLPLHKRTNSQMSEASRKYSAHVEANGASSILDDMDDDSIQDFDDLMKSGTTMKVSLTPDRLRSFDVASKRGNRLGRVPPPAADTSATPKENVASPERPGQGERKPAAPVSRTVSNTRIVRNPVDSIDEDEEESPVNRGPSSRPPPGVPSVSAQQQQQSMAQGAQAFPTIPSPNRPPVSRPRSRTEGSSQAPQPQFHPPMPTNNKLAQMGMQAGPGPQAQSRKPSRNRESLDLDDIMNGSDSEEPVIKSSLTPKPAMAVSSNARDLMDFLADGPPEAPSINNSSLPEPRKSGGRFRSMVSRLTSRGSSERLTSARPSEDDTFSRSLNGPPRQTLNGKRSVSNLQNFPRPPRPPALSPSSSIYQTSTQIPPPLRSAPAPADPPMIVPSPRTASLARKPVSSDHSMSETVVDPTYVQPSPLSTKSATSSPRSAAFPKRPVAIVEMPSHPIEIPEPSPVSPSARSSTTVSVDHRGEKSSPIRQAPSRSISRVQPPMPPFNELPKLLERAKSADECRLLVDMFLARNGLRTDTHIENVPVPSNDRGQVVTVEHNGLVDYLLGDSTDTWSSRIGTPV
ncbi:hypothetical protein SISSUDRAFT_1125212 [Sistotremastrum suecicum HHB10207 ss-3]|uniref:Uncharacterized protein n=1 Tax=Sistotremastrum suecicum HHB10207 ss-3 TaxID=1314776 RepID=A0A166HQC5_9AGAM|nr:hypothetical protein SISSUDRAFT_1125212 [Sistotremastrum suecicum HHB10207 ss-3]